MEIKLTEEIKQISLIREYKISIGDIESDGVGCEFLVRSVHEKGQLKYFLYRFSKDKWSKKPSKLLLEDLDIDAEDLFFLLKEFISMGSDVNQSVFSLRLYDFTNEEEEEEEEEGEENV